jgi:hypothetical protein
VSSPTTFDFMLQPAGKIEIDGDTFTIEGESARLFGKVIAPAGAALSLHPGLGEHINVENPLTLRISAPGESAEVEFIVVLVPLVSGQNAPEIASLTGTIPALRVSAQSLGFSPDTLSPPTLH